MTVRMADWLTYTDIEQLKQLNRFYGGVVSDHHSKHDLICAVLRKVGKKSSLDQMVVDLSPSQHRFMQLIILDHSPSYTMEELLAKGRAALQNDQGEPRSLVVGALKRGWLFTGYSHRTQYLYHIPSDLREQMTDLFIRPFLNDIEVLLRPPSFYRNEEGQLVKDLYRFLDLIRKEVLRLTLDGAIHKQQQKQLLKTFVINEDVINQKGPRFGFGRMYHLYPDRFSLLYDYAFYKGYFRENKENLSLTDIGNGYLYKNDSNADKQLYRFWIRLYRKPIPHLPIILRWIGLLSRSKWMPTEQIYKAVNEWISPYYYESQESLFRKTIQMLVHLGILQFGVEQDQSLVKLTQSGVKWMHGISAFREQVIEEGFIKSGK
ncbi:hypothetical protein EDD58_10725 [Hazenella coriacea]|uniref:Uncharacterized protein n=1 Tax=Hazenella coriacea TaxID=1179467 RepID=A0A4R3L1T0_9BACL|nr:hypothetical protein EDD58_10725 [Hazenella coriacea]